MARRIDFVRAAAARLLGVPAASRTASSSCRSRRRSGAITGPTDDRATVADAIADQPRGGTAILDALVDAAEARSSGLEGRHAIVLLTDGYDEHSTRQRSRRRLRRVQQRSATVYVDRRRRRGRHLAEGRAVAEAAGSGDRRPGVLPVARRTNCRSCTSGSPPTWRSATSSPTRRRTRRSTARGGESALATDDPGADGARQARVLRAEAAAGAAVDRVHGDGPTRRCWIVTRDDLRSSKTAWRRARGVPGGDDARCRSCSRSTRAAA